MIVSSWNCRGAGGRHFPSTLKKIVSEYHIDIMCLLETRISGVKADRVSRKLGFSNWLRLEAAGFAGGIWILWDDTNIQIEYITSNTQFIHCRIVDRRTPAERFITFVYGEPSQHKRTGLWEALTNLAPSILSPWLVIGDFNTFLNEDDKLGGIRPSIPAMQSFGECIKDTGLIDLPIEGEKYTWEKTHVKERLDWAFCNIHWLLKFNQSRVSHKLFFKSDHRIIVVSDAQDMERRTTQQKGICYRAAWALEESFGNLVNNTWADCEWSEGVQKPGSNPP